MRETVLAFVKTWTRRLALVLALPVGGAVFLVLYVIATVASYEQLDNSEKLASKNAYLAALPRAVSALSPDIVVILSSRSPLRLSRYGHTKARKCAQDPSKTVHMF